jgi:hypothetical protein
MYKASSFKSSTAICDDFVNFGMSALLNSMPILCFPFRSNKSNLAVSVTVGRFNFQINHDSRRVRIV